MAELGALSLRIETTGDAQALRSLDALDTKARKTDITLEQTVQALNKLGISARQVSGSIQVADTQLSQATQIVRGLGSQAQVTAGQVAQMGVASTKAVVAPTQSLQVFGKELVTTGGKLSAFGKSGLNAFNALSFGISQMAATGQMSFRSLATSMASVLAFFGPQGAIASGVVSLGLILVDFWRRQRREIEETKQKVLESIDAAAVARRERDDPVGVAEDRLAVARQALRDEKDRLNRLLATPVQQKTSGTEALIADARDRVAKASTRELNVLRELNDARAKGNAKQSDEIGLLADAIRARQATATQIQRANALMAQARFVLEATKNANVEDTATMARRAQAIQTLTTLTDAFKQKTGEVVDVEKERQKAIAEEIGALASLSKSRGTTGAELLRLIQLEGALIAELATGLPTKEREAEIWEQITKARQTASQALPQVQVQPLTSARPQAAQRIEMPASVQAKLDPKAIAEDTARMDQEMAARVAAFNWSETQDALSQSLGNAIGSGVAFAFAQGLGQGGIGEGFRQMTAQLAQGLGAVAIDYGLKAKAVAELMAGISKFLIANPWLAIAGGIALVALGTAMGGRRSGGGVGGFSGGGGGTSGTTPVEISRLIVDPNASARQQAASRLAGSQMATAPAAGPTWGRPLVVTSPEGKRVIATANDSFNRKR